MQNKINVVFSITDRDKVLDLISQAMALLPGKVDLTSDDRQSMLKMGDWGRPLVEQTLVLAEQNDEFLPRSFNVAEMRKDKDFVDMISPVNVQVLRFADAVRDLLLLAGSDLMLAAYEVYANAKENGQGEHLDSLIPLVGRRFKNRVKKKDEESSKEDDGNEGDDGENPPS
jgi:hypothetical protein